MKKGISAPLDSLLVKFKSGVAVYVMLMHEDGSTSELRGREMFAWLDEFALHLKIYPRVIESSRAILSASPKQTGLADGAWLANKARTRKAR